MDAVSSNNVSQDFLAGLLAGVANVASGHPFDTVKVVLQAARPHEYTGAVHCTRRLLAESGLTGLYRGVAAPLVGGALETAVNYAAYYRVRANLPEAWSSTHKGITDPSHVRSSAPASHLARAKPSQAARLPARCSAASSRRWSCSSAASNRAQTPPCS